MGKEISKKELDLIVQNKKLRQKLAYEDPLWFFLIYMRKYMEFPLAPFQKDMFKLLRDSRNKLITIMAFRNSGKSTIMNTTNTLWSILGTRQNKFIVIVGQTQEQAKTHFANIKEELEHNPLLKEDFGPFHGNESVWKKLSLELEYHGSKIVCVSREQSVRGFKYGANRPDLIICDDLEDSFSFEDKKISENMYNRFVSEILPLGNEDTRIIVLGNLISGDSLLVKLKEQIKEKKMNGIFRAYPLLDDNEKIMWLEKFKTMANIGKLKKTISDEYFGKIVRRPKSEDRSQETSRH